MMKEIAEKLQKARKSVGLNQNQVADNLGISRSKLINIEKGEVSIDIILLEKICKLYGYSMNYFIDSESKEDEEISFAFRATDLQDNDLYIPAWGRKILMNIKNLDNICKEAGL